MASPWKVDPNQTKSNRISDYGENVKPRPISDLWWQLYTAGSLDLETIGSLMDSTRNLIVAAIGVEKAANDAIAAAIAFAKASAANFDYEGQVAEIQNTTLDEIKRSGFESRQQFFSEWCYEWITSGLPFHRYLPFVTDPLLRSEINAYIRREREYPKEFWLDEKYLFPEPSSAVQNIAESVFGGLKMALASNLARVAANAVGVSPVLPTLLAATRPTTQTTAQTAVSAQVFQTAAPLLHDLRSKALAP